MKRNTVWQHVLIWIGLYILWVILFQNRTLTVSRTLTVQFCYLAFVAAVYYFIIYFSVPDFLYKKNYLLFASTLLGAIALAALL